MPAPVEVSTAAAPAPTPVPAVAGPAARWGSLDGLRGLALVLMITHHFHNWTAGGVRERFIGFPGFVVTDLAAPVFAVGVGAAGYLVGRSIAAPRQGGVDRARAGRALRRWGEVLALGLAIDVALDGGVEGGGVLPTLAALGVAVTALSTMGLRWPTGWWILAGAAAVFAVPVTSGDPVGFLSELWAGPFSVVVYGVFAFVGAGLAASADGGGERALPLIRTAVAAVGLGTAAWLVAGIRLAPEGFWPPDRAPGGLAYTVWGLVGTLVLWTVLRRWLADDSVTARGLARCGRRTLSVFGLHYLVKLGLQYSGHLRELDTPGWRWATWAAVGVACLVSMLPSPNRTAEPR